MADPLSIATACAAALNSAGTVAWKFQQFIESTKSINRTIGEMARETRTIELSLRSIKKTLNSKTYLEAEAKLASNMSDISESTELKEAMLGSLSDCQVSPTSLFCCIVLGFVLLQA